MPAPRIRCDHDSLRDIASRFNQQADACRGMASTIRRSMEVLRSGDWIGVGATKFYGEMDSAILPALNRLVSALQQAASVTNTVSRVMSETEDEASRLFGDGLGGGLEGALSSAVGAAVAQVGQAAGAAVAGGAGAAAIGGLLGAAIGSALASAAVVGAASANIGIAVASVVASVGLTVVTGGAANPAQVGELVGAAMAASKMFQGVGAEVGEAIGSAVQSLLGQGAASSAIGAAVGSALQSGGLLSGFAVGGEGAVMPAIATLAGIVGAASGKISLADLSSLNLADVAVTPTPAGPIPIPYPNVQMGFGVGQGLGALLNGGNVADVGSSLMQSLGFSSKGIPEFVNEVRGAMDSANTLSANLNLDIQQAQQQLTQTVQTLSNVSKAIHDVQMEMIRSMRA